MALFYAYFIISFNQNKRSRKHGRLFYLGQHFLFIIKIVYHSVPMIIRLGKKHHESPRTRRSPHTLASRFKI